MTSLEYLRNEAQQGYGGSHTEEADAAYLQAQILAELALLLKGQKAPQPHCPQLFRLVDGRVINLDNVTRIYNGETENFHSCLIIEYVGGERSFIFPEDKQVYQQVSAWMESLPSLSLYEG